MRITSGDAAGAPDRVSGSTACEGGRRLRRREIETPGDEPHREYDLLHREWSLEDPGGEAEQAQQRSGEVDQSAGEPPDGQPPGDER